jgi:hypothetical protein
MAKKAILPSPFEKCAVFFNHLCSNACFICYTRSPLGYGSQPACSPLVEIRMLKSWQKTQNCPVFHSHPTVFSASLLPNSAAKRNLQENFLFKTRISHATQQQPFNMRWHVM